MNLFCLFGLYFLFGFNCCLSLNVSNNDAVYYLKDRNVPQPEFFVSNFVERNISITHENLDMIHSYFSTKMPQHSSRNARDFDFSFVPEFPTTLEGANLFCCGCLKYELNCPVCYRRNYYTCEIPNFNYSSYFKYWHSDVFLPLYKSVNIPMTTVYTHTGSGFIYSRTTSDVFMVINSNSPCSINNQTVPYDFSQPELCTIVINKFKDCPRTTKNLYVPGCDWSYTEEKIINQEFKACVSPRKNEVFVPRSYSYGKDIFCNFIGNTVKFPALGTFVEAAVGIPSYYYWDSKFLGISDNLAVFSVQESLDFYKILSRMHYESITVPNYFTVLQRVSCNGDYTTSAAYNGKPSWIGDKVIFPECSKYISFNSSHLICYDSLFLGYFHYCSDYVFRRGTVNSRYHYTVNIENIDFQSSFTCNSLNYTSFCAFKGLIDYFLNSKVQYNYYTGYFDTVITRFINGFKEFTQLIIKEVRNSTNYFIREISKVLKSVNINIYPALNKSLDNAINNFFDALGRNSSIVSEGVHLCKDSKCPKTVVGNWFSGIFASLITPFFEAFLSIVVKAFLVPLVDGLTEVIDVLIPSLQNLTDKLLNFLTHLVSVITKLLVVVIKFLIGVIILVESQLLLFEYTLLFLFIIKKIVNNTVFAIIIVIIFVLIFGIVRKSPSLLLALIDPDFLYVDLTTYYSANFSYNYTSLVINWILNNTRN